MVGGLGLEKEKGKRKQRELLACLPSFENIPSLLNTTDEGEGRGIIPFCIGSAKPVARK